jgi:hypothetical protein
VEDDKQFKLPLAEAHNISETRCWFDGALHIVPAIKKRSARKTSHSRLPNPNFVVSKDF